MSEHDLPAGEAKGERSEPSAGTVRCSFCGRNQHSRMLIVNPPCELQRAYICDECVIMCVTLLIDSDIIDYEITLGPVKEARTFETLRAPANEAPEKTEPNPAGGKS